MTDSPGIDPVIEAYSRLAGEYGAAENQESCWGRSSRNLWPRLRPRPEHRLVADVGCGPGATLVDLASRVAPGTRLIGVEPAAGLREQALAATAALPAVEIRDGRFESLPFADGEVDYLYSIMAFHWVADPEAGAREVARVLGPGGEADLHFIGRWNGREFIKATSPIFLRHMGPARLLSAAQLRRQLTVEAARQLFRGALPDRAVEVDERYETHHDTLEGHWAWWVRIEGQMLSIPADRRKECEREVREALAKLATPEGIPYTLHILHVRVGPG
jgi:SAM-dependent methyltransferase